MNVFCEKIGETIAYEEYPDGVRIIPHNKLEDILRRYSARFLIEVKPVLISPEMCLVECRATDKETGETVLKVGESNPSNLETEIARKYPGTLAYQRAIDRGVVAILGLGAGGKYYSSHEILCQEGRLESSPASRKKDEDGDFEFVDKFIEELESVSESGTGEPADSFFDPSVPEASGKAGEEAGTEDGSVMEDSGFDEHPADVPSGESLETTVELDTDTEIPDGETEEKEEEAVDLDIDDFDDLFDEELEPEPEPGPEPEPETKPEPVRKHPKTKRSGITAKARPLTIRRPEEEPDWDDFEEPGSLGLDEDLADSLEETTAILEGPEEEPDDLEDDLELEVDDEPDADGEFNEFLEESILIGPFIGRKVKDVVSTPRFKTFIKLIVRNSKMGGVLHFNDDARSGQVKRFEKFADRLSAL